MVAERSFDNVYREQYPHLVGLGVAMTGNNETARDLAQETMLRAHQRWDDVSQYDHIGAWLRRVMTNLLIDHHRRHGAEDAAMLRLGPPCRVALAADVVDAAVWAELIAPLSARQRAVIALRYGEDLPVERVAAVLGIRVGTVKSSLARARERIARSFEQEECDEREG